MIVTYNRADVLVGCLDGLATQTSPPDAVFVVDNASSDHTAEVLQARTDLPLRIIRSEENLGGAGGFHLGVGLAYDAGFDRIWLMDDDVVPAPWCLQVLLDHPGPALMAVREDTAGRLVREGRTRLRPGATRSRSGPSARSVDDRWHLRSEMPAEVVLENVAFEGFMVHRRVIDAIGLPDPSYFIFYDDCDFAIRARRAGFTLVGVRDAVLVRQLDFDQQHALRHVEGVLHVPEPLRGPLPVRRERPGPAQAVPDRARGRRTVPVPRGSRRGAQRDPCHPRCAWHAPRPTRGALWKG